MVVAYRTDISNRDRSGAIGLVIAIHAALLFAFLHLSGKIDLADPQVGLSVFNIGEPPLPPPPAQQRQQPKPREKEGGSSPKNIKSEATPVVAPKPRIETPQVQQIAASETPRQGAASTQGASNVRGPGTGAGGVGTGTGSGAGGNGPGGGGGGVAVPVALVRGISGRDYPEAVRASWPRGGIVFLRLRIEANGRPSRCDVMRGFGSPSIDQWTCALVMQRGQFRPALDARGVPVSAWFGYKQVDIGR